MEQEKGDSSSSDSDNNVSLAQVSKDLKSKSTKEDGSETKELSREKGRRNTRKRKVSYNISDAELDYSDLNDTYKPKKCDLNSSDSECETHHDLIDTSGKTKKSKTSQSKTTRDKAWKRRPKPIRRKLFRAPCKSTPELITKIRTKRKSQILKRKPQKMKPSCSPQMKRAISKSLKEKSLNQLIEKYHTQRLDQLLHSNDLKRITVTADGNCFLELYC